MQAFSPWMFIVIIEPIDTQARQSIIAATEKYICLASDFFKRSFEVIPVSFGLKGRAAGMYRVRKGRREIRYNPHLFAKYFADNLARTVPHEVAHYIAHELYGLGKVRPHGKEWQAIMQRFGVDACRTCDYDLEGIPVRKYQRHVYQCRCTTHELGSRRHKQAQRGRTQYFCKSCKGKLVPRIEASPETSIEECV